MATPKKLRFTAKVDYDKKMKDWYFDITDSLNGDQVIKKNGYSSKKSAVRGLIRLSKSLLQGHKIAIVK